MLITSTSKLYLSTVLESVLLSITEQINHQKVVISYISLRSVKAKNLQFLSQCLISSLKDITVTDYCQYCRPFNQLLTFFLCSTSPSPYFSLRSYVGSTWRPNPPCVARTVWPAGAWRGPPYQQVLAVEGVRTRPASAASPPSSATAPSTARPPPTAPPHPGAKSQPSPTWTSLLVT